MKRVYMPATYVYIHMSIRRTHPDVYKRSQLVQKKKERKTKRPMDLLCIHKLYIHINHEVRENFI